MEEMVSKMNIKGWLIIQLQRQIDRSTIRKKSHCLVLATTCILTPHLRHLSFTTSFLLTGTVKIHVHVKDVIHCLYTVKALKRIPHCKFQWFIIHKGFTIFMQSEFCNSWVSCWLYYSPHPDFHAHLSQVSAQIPLPIPHRLVDG